MAFTYSIFKLRTSVYVTAFSFALIVPNMPCNALISGV
jgi:hypothetical protein